MRSKAPRGRRALRSNEPVLVAGAHVADADRAALASDTDPDTHPGTGIGVSAGD